MHHREDSDLIELQNLRLAQKRLAYTLGRTTSALIVQKVQGT